ncbi:MAG: hypothetical protein WCN98_13230 [Verrucomicrobiaceae bacterium]
MKRGAMQALEHSRASMGGDFAVMREQWNPRELVRQSVEKHKVALIIAAAAVAGIVTVRIFAGNGKDQTQRPKGSWLTGVLTSSLWAVARKPLTDFAKEHFMNYFSKFQTSLEPEQPE